MPNMLTSLYNSIFNMKERAAPGTPASGYGYFYFKTDKTLHIKDSTGLDTLIGPLTSAELPVGVPIAYAVIADQKTAGTTGGTFSTGAWRTRDLNTEYADPQSVVSISGNQFTLGAGTYVISASAPCYNVGGHKARLYNATDAAVIKEGQGNYAYEGGSLTESFATVLYAFTLAGSKALEIQHRCEVSGSFGIPTNVYFTVDFEIYTTVQIWQVKA